MSHVKPLKDKLYEIRIRVDKNAYRIIYFLHTGQKFILLHGFQKKTQKTPTKELELIDGQKSVIIIEKADEQWV